VGRFSAKDLLLVCPPFPRVPEVVAINVLLPLLGKENRKNWEGWQRDAQEWFFSEETTPGSFYWVCEVSHIGSWRILKGLRIRRDRKQLEEVVRKLSEFKIRPQSFAGS